MKSIRQRLANRKAQQKAYIQRRREDRLMHAYDIMRNFENAFGYLKGHPIEVTYEKGWFKAKGYYLPRMREKTIVAETNKLYAAAHERELGGNHEESSRQQSCSLH